MEVITYSRIGKEDIRFGKGMFETVLADQRKVMLHEVDLGAILRDPDLSTDTNSDLWFNVRFYGADTPGEDHTAAIQAALDAAVAQGAGVVMFPYLQGGYFAGDLTLAPTSGQVHIDLLGLGGTGANGVQITYTGSGGTCLTIKNNTQYSMKGLRLQNGTTGSIGLHLTSLAVGSNHGDCIIENVVVEGFTTDYQFGDSSNRAASEIMLINCKANSAGTGILLQGPGSGTSFTTNVWAFGLKAQSNSVVVKVAGDNTGTQPAFTLVGFSFSQNTLEFDFQVPGVYRITGGYTEHATTGQFLKSGSATATSNSAMVTKVAVESVTVNYVSSPSNFLALCYQPGNYAMRECTMSTGSIQLGGFDGGGGARKSSLVLDGCTLSSASTVVAYKASSNTIWNVRIEGSGTANTEAVNTLEDRHYLFNTSGTELVIAKYGAWSASAGGDALSAALGTRVVLTANLPAASADMDNTVLIENTGAGCNFVAYRGGARFRVAMTAF